MLLFERNWAFEKIVPRITLVPKINGENYINRGFTICTHHTWPTFLGCFLKETEYLRESSEDNICI
jgi:hypothetical protein